MNNATRKDKTHRCFAQTLPVSRCVRTADFRQAVGLFRWIRLLNW